MNGKDNLTISSANFSDELSYNEFAHSADAYCHECHSVHGHSLEHTDSEALITIDHVSMGWDGRKVLDDISMSVYRGDFIAITGPNGGGKTTLLKLLLGLIRPMTGRVIHNTDNLRIGYLPQKNLIDSQYPITVSEVIKSGLLGIKGLGKEERQRKYERAVHEVGLEDHVSQSIGVLSGGQLQRALLARAIISEPVLLVLDEPLSYIDKRFEAHLYDIIRRLAQDTTIVLVSHEMSTLAGMANRHFIVDCTLHACNSHHHFARYACDE